MSALATLALWGMLALTAADVCAQMPARDRPDARVVRETRARIRAVRQCIERARRAQPHVGGRIVVAFSALADGRLGKFRVVENGTGNAALAECVIESLRSARNPPPDVPGTRLRIQLFFPPSS